MNYGQKILNLVPISTVLGVAPDPETVQKCVGVRGHPDYPEM